MQNGVTRSRPVRWLASFLVLLLAPAKVAKPIRHYLCRLH